MHYQLKEVVIEITKQCNMHCRHCGSDCNEKKDDGELSFAKWQNIFCQMADMGVGKVVFSGGEPTIRHDFPEILKCAGNLGLRHAFISNGLKVFSNCLIEAMHQARTFAVGLSVDGMRQTHNKMRNSEKSWDAVMHNITILQQAQIKICIITTISKLNMGDLPKIAQWLDLYEIPVWQLQIASPMGRMSSNTGLLISEEEFRKLCNDVVEIRKQYSSMQIEAADCFGRAPAGLIRSGEWQGCSAGIYSMGIDARGNCMPCLSMQGCTGESLRRKVLEEIWTSSSMFDFNRQFSPENVQGVCEKCHDVLECRGGCASQSLAQSNCLHGSPYCFQRSSTNDGE